MDARGPTEDQRRDSRNVTGALGTSTRAEAFASSKAYHDPKLLLYAYFTAHLPLGSPSLAPFHYLFLHAVVAFG